MDYTFTELLAILKEVKEALSAVLRRNGFGLCKGAVSMEKFFMLLGCKHGEGPLAYHHSGRVYGPFPDDPAREEAMVETGIERERVRKEGEVFLCFEGSMVNSNLVPILPREKIKQPALV
ncbi:MAG: hypothetical protein V1704_00565 [Candidatus Vogelbacteria bacterium]